MFSGNQFLCHPVDKQTNHAEAIMGKGEIVNGCIYMMLLSKGLNSLSFSISLTYTMMAASYLKY